MMEWNYWPEAVGALVLLIYAGVIVGIVKIVLWCLEDD